MNSRRLAELIFAAFMAAASIWIVPVDWTLNIFLGAIGITFVLGILAGASAKENKPNKFSIGLLSFMLIGTSRPTAEVKDVMALRLFLLGFAVVVDLLVGVLVVSNV